MAAVQARRPVVLAVVEVRHVVEAVLLARLQVALRDQGVVRAPQAVRLPHRARSTGIVRRVVMVVRRRVVRVRSTGIVRLVVRVARVNVGLVVLVRSMGIVRRVVMVVRRRVVRARSTEIVRLVRRVARANAVRARTSRRMVRDLVPAATVEAIVAVARP